MTSRGMHRVGSRRFDGFDQGRRHELLGTAPRADASVLLVNDVVTTGEGLRTLGSVAVQAGAAIAGAAWFASRNEIDVTEKIGAPAAWVVSLDLPTVTPGQCPWCSAGLPVEDALDLN